MKKQIYSIAFLGLTAILGYGQSLVSGGGVEVVRQQISIDDALTCAYTNNHLIDAAQYNIDASIHRKKAAWGLGAPKLSIGANYTYMSQDVGNIDFNAQKNTVVDFLGTLPIPLPEDLMSKLRSADFSYTLQKREFATVDATLIVPIFTGGKINAAHNAAKIGVSQAKNEMAEVQNRLFIEVTEYYWGLSLAHNLQYLQSEFVKAISIHAQHAQQLEKNGIIAYAERLFTDMALSQAKAALVISTNNTQTVNTALSATLGQRGEYVPTTSLFINRNIESLDFFKQQTLQNSHALEKMELVKKLSQEAVKLERSNFFPTIGAMGAANIWNYNLTNQLPRWVAGATVSWNLFNGLTREHNFAAVKANVRQVEALQVKANIDIQTLVEKLYNQIKNSVEQVDAANATIVFAMAYLTTQQKAFSEGMATSINVVDAQLNLNKACVERMAAAYAFDVSLAQLLALSGLSQSFGEYQMGDGYEVIL